VSLSLRTATAADAEDIARLAIEGMEDYPSFAPEEWTPPSLQAEVEHLRALLGDPQVWCLLAKGADGIVGQITVLPAARAVHPVEDPGLAHLRGLFVDKDLWGTGLARDLHAAAVQAARGRGFTQMRLFTPARHGRARRFYEREGWVTVGDEFHEPVLGLALVEYRYAVSTSIG
jgi:GNAT superfamily N-acetyltransferase